MKNELQATIEIDTTAEQKTTTRCRRDSRGRAGGRWISARCCAASRLVASRAGC